MSRANCIPAPARTLALNPRLNLSLHPALSLVWEAAALAADIRPTVVAAGSFYVIVAPEASAAVWPNHREHRSASCLV